MKKAKIGKKYAGKRLKESCRTVEGSSIGPAEYIPGAARRTESVRLLSQ